MNSGKSTSFLEKDVPSGPVHIKQLDRSEINLAALCAGYGRSTFFLNSSEINLSGIASGGRLTSL